MNARLDVESMTHRQLVAYASDLEAQVGALSGLFNESRQALLQRVFGLTRSEARLVEALADGKNKTKVQLLEAIYWQRTDDPPELKIIDVFVCKSRKKLDGSGVSIETLWGYGYHLSGVDTLVEILAGAPLADDAETEPPQIGRQPGAVSRPHGSTRDAVLRFLQERARKGVASVTTRELSRTAGGLSGSTALRDLERHKRVSVLSAPSRGNRGGQWVVALK